MNKPSWIEGEAKAQGQCPLTIRYHGQLALPSFTSQFCPATFLSCLQTKDLVAMQLKSAH